MRRRIRMDYARSRWVNRHFGEFSADGGEDRMGGFSVKRVFLTVNSAGHGKPSIRHRDVTWARRIITLYKAGERHGFVPTYPSREMWGAGRHSWKGFERVRGDGRTPQ